MKNPVEEIHEIRERHYEATKNMTNEELRSLLNERTRQIMKNLEKQKTAMKTK